MKSYESSIVSICPIFTAQCTLVQSHVDRPSVCLSVCLSVALVDCDHIGWKSWKLIAQTIIDLRVAAVKSTWVDLAAPSQVKSFHFQVAAKIFHSNRRRILG